MSAQEVLAIADFVHQRSNYRGLFPQPGVSEDTIVARILESPIYDVTAKESEVVVRFGYMHGFLWGSGLMVMLECVPGAYKIKSWGQWAS